MSKPSNPKTHPYMPTEPTNKDRVERARKGLKFYQTKALGESGALDEGTLVDLLTDLMHLSDADSDFPFEQSLTTAAMHHTAEVADESRDRRN